MQSRNGMESWCEVVPDSGAGMTAKRIAQWNFLNATFTIPLAEGWGAPSSGGTITQRTVANTSLLTSCRRQGMVSAAAANTIIHWRSSALNWVTSAIAPGTGTVRAGRWKLLIVAGISDAVINPEARWFLGFHASVLAPAVADPTTYVNSFGIGNNTGDTTLHAISRDGAGNFQHVDLGASFPVNATGAFYKIVLSGAQDQVAPMAYQYEVTNLNTGAYISGSLSGTGVPAAQTAVSQVLCRTTGATSALAVGFDTALVRLETDV